MPGNALKKGEETRARALGLPGGAGERPWGGTVAGAGGKVGAFLGVDDGGYPLRVMLKPEDGPAPARTPARPGAAPAGHGPGGPGRAGTPPEPGCSATGWGETRRTGAPERPTAEPDARWNGRDRRPPRTVAKRLLALGLCPVERVPSIAGDTSTVSQWSGELR